MSFLTLAYLLEKYGPLLTEDQVGEVLHMSGKTIRNQRSMGTFPIQCSKRGDKVLFHAADVAEHVEAMRSVKHAS